MSQAILQSACTKLRSAIGDEATVRLNLTSDFEEMLEKLEAVDVAIPRAENWFLCAVSYDGEPWLAKVRDTAYRVCRMVDELHEMANSIHQIPEDAGTTENAMLTTIKRNIQELHWDMESASFPDALDRTALIRAQSATEERVTDAQRVVMRLSAHRGNTNPIILLIHGPIGFGKATVAATVFEDSLFKCYSRIWINHSYRLRPQEIGKYIISQFVSTGREEERSVHGSTDDNMEMEYIKGRLHEILNGKKLLVVLPDLWTDASSWKMLKDMLTVRGTGSPEVIVLATVALPYPSPGYKVALDIFGVYPFWLDTSSAAACCTSVVKQAATRSEAGSAEKQDLELIAPAVATLSRGIPLAAQIYGSVLQFKHYREWPEILDFRLFSNASPVYVSLVLSYRSMTPNLRLCFGYCGFVFTAGRDVTKEDLIHQWIALDLIEASKAFSATQLAEQYHRRLCDMSLLQTAKPSRTSAKDCSCAVLFTMHAGVREFAANSLGDTFGVLPGRGTETELSKLCSYVMVYYILYLPVESRLLSDNMRALHLVECRAMILSDDSFSFPRSLCVLEIHDDNLLQELPRSICQLRHLGYLKLSGWSVLENLPESIGGLINLLHIDLSSCSRLVNLPGSFGKLNKLVHINLSGCSALVNLPECIGKLANLVHINLSGCSALVSLPEFFSKLVNLVHVNLSGCLGLVNLPRSLGKLTKLEHINSSGCIALVNLPGSFEKLTKLKHINLSGCSKLVNLPGSFGKLTKLEQVNISGCTKLLNLPGSFGKLTNLVHINLSGSNGLANLPGTFGDLTSLAHINMSGCSGLQELPESFGKLVSLLHLDLSGCSGLATLPGSFGDLQNLLHVDLSRCHGLSKLPESFAKLEKLEHLDLSFWSCFEGIQTALGGLTNLQYLNLSQPCCYHADYQHLTELEEVLGQFTRLKHLNLSMFLNPIFCNQSEVDNLEYMGFISGFSRLEYLDLSQNVFLVGLPESLHGLERLHTLDISGCIRFKKLGGPMDQMQSLKTVIFTNLESFHFVVPGDAINKYGPLMGLSCKELEITCLERMKSMEEEPRSIRLAEKQNLQKLKLCWTVSSGRRVEDNASGRPVGVNASASSAEASATGPPLEDKDLLEELMPPHSLQHLELCGYSSTCFPSWLRSRSIAAFNIVEITMVDIPKCSQLPQLGLLRNLQSVVLGGMDNITKIDAGELSGGNTAAFGQLSSFIIKDMASLEEFTYHSSGGGGGGGEEELLFRVIDYLEFKNCPKLSFLPPRAQKLVIYGCSVAMVCRPNTAGIDGVEGPSCISSTVSQVSELEVQHCTVSQSNCYLLNHLPGLLSLIIKGCDNLLVCSPEIAGVLSSLQTLRFHHCSKMDTLPEHVGGLSSLRDLRIEDCHVFQHLPESIQQLTSLQTLHFTDCPSLKELPDWLGSLTTLENLTIRNCRSLDDLPYSIGELTNLKDLVIKSHLLYRWWRDDRDNRKALRKIQPRFEPDLERHDSNDDY